jgi:hypothetical protein
VKLLTAKAVVLASKAVRIKDGKTLSVSLTLSVAARRKLIGRKPKVKGSWWTSASAARPRRP